MSRIIYEAPKPHKCDLNQFYDLNPNSIVQCVCGRTYKLYQHPREFLPYGLFGMLAHWLRRLFKGSAL